MKLKGADQLIGKLKRNANLGDVKNVVKMNGSEMQRSAQRYAPVDTGNLKRNIKYNSQDDGFTAQVASEAEYAAYQEYGTRYQSGKPHVRPAYHEQKSKFVTDMKRLMK
ncbi:HK97-gp10 family putative phage morphogenesis protein [Virgibacillus halophilus]|uniref:HK97 gp10 family phage protein n=1 Tax=Tigheibacillus halophilus TaxID=361280 RepID=A0ABU5C6D5_9BACI|nr:HK97 gp10 family phage protein [Virgibacillus halophilus]